MSLIVLGCNHKSSPLNIFESITISADGIPSMLRYLANSHNLNEVLILSTCNRVEVYVHAEKFHDGCADVREALAMDASLAIDTVADTLYTHYDTGVVEHLFRVAAGLESVVIGEHEILGQIRSAWHTAQSEGTVGSVLSPLFQHALSVGKQARSSTAIGRGITSVSQAATALAKEHLHSLAGQKVLVVGTGDVGEGTLASIAAMGVADISVANRTWDKAVRTARTYRGTAVPLDNLHSALLTTDLLITTTGASDIIIEHGDIARVMRERARATQNSTTPTQDSTTCDRATPTQDSTTLLIIDIAIPRDVDPASAQIPGVTLLNMSDIKAFIAQGIKARHMEIVKVEAIVASETERYLSEVSARAVTPVVSALHAQAEAICASEIVRHKNRLKGLNTEQQASVELLVKSVTRKLLHNPTVRLKDAAGEPKGNRMAETLRDLFDLKVY